MRVGVDFDNTIVSYDTAFYETAVEWSLVPVNLLKSKLAVRDYLRNNGEEAAWTELQGYVYGKKMVRAEAYPSVIEFFKFARDQGHSIFIISHKTKNPIIGKTYDLHGAAIEWIEKNLIDCNSKLLNSDNIFFEPTKEKKISRIMDSRCDFFIDDLPEILLMAGFPKKCKRILFDPTKSHTEKKEYVRIQSWSLITNFFKNIQ